MPVEFIRMKKLEFFLDNPLVFRILFFILLFFSSLINYYFPNTSSGVHFVFLMIVSSFAFWNTWIQLFISLIVTLNHFYFSPSHTFHLGWGIFEWIPFFLISFIITNLIKHYIKAKTATLNLVIALAKAMDSRDSYTTSHSENVARYAKMIAEELKLSKVECERIYIGGILHDIGKIGIPEVILTKPSNLTREEFDHIKRHPILGYEMLKHISHFRVSGILDMILYHHERYDGSGYPKRLRGKEIPLAARIIAVADSFDAMTSNRVYRQAKSVDFAIQQIFQNKGSQFDPDVAEAFSTVLDKQSDNIQNQPNRAIM